MFGIDQVLAQANTANNTAVKAAEFLPGFVDVVYRISLVVILFVVALLIARIIISRVTTAIRKNDSQEEHREISVLASRLIYIIAGTVSLAIGLGVTNTFAEIAWLFGAVGLGIGFAFQTIIGNFVAGISLLIQRKVRIGDMVEIDGTRGIVTSIGSRCVILHDFHGHDFLIPNLDFFNKQVKVYTANPYRRIWIEIGVGYDTEFPKAYEKIMEILTRYPEVEKEPPPDILIDKVQSSTVNMQIRWWIKSNLRWWTLQSSILRDVFVELQRNGIDISFPVQTLRIDKHESAALYEYLTKAQK